jgi:hypothetical protein
MKVMSVGGNDAARLFFKDKGWDAAVSAKVRSREGEVFERCRGRALPRTPTPPFSHPRHPLAPHPQSPIPNSPAQIDEKYTSRAAKMYRAQLHRLLGKEEEADSHDDFHSHSSSSNAYTTTAGRGDKQPSPTPLSSEWVTPAQAKAAVAAYEAEEQEAHSHEPVAVDPQTPIAVANHVTAVSSRATDGAQGDAELDVGAITGKGAGAGAGAGASSASSPSGEFKRPTIIGVRPAAGGKMGAKKLGAVKVGGAVGVSSSGAASFDFDKDDGSSSSAPASSSATLSADGVAKTLAKMELGELPRYSTGGGAGAGSASGSGAASKDASGNDFSRFKNAKGISSDMLFGGPANEAQAREDTVRMAQFSSARAISSDAFFGQGEAGSGAGAGSGGGGGGGGGARYGTGGRAGSEGLGDFMDKLTSGVGDDLRRVSETVKERASKVKEGLSIIADAMRR